MTDHVSLCHTYAEASEELALKITAKFGSNPAVIDDLRFQCLPAPHQGSDLSGFALLAYPAKEGPTSESLLAVYYGPAPEARHV